VSSRYCWWDGTRYTTWTSRAGEGWTYASVTDEVATVHSRRLGIAAAVALGGLALAFGALLTGTDPDPGNRTDAGTLTAFFIAGGTIFVVGVAIATVELIRGVRDARMNRRRSEQPHRL
jgi:hypothetical protein